MSGDGVPVRDECEERFELSFPQLRVAVALGSPNPRSPFVRSGTRIPTVIIGCGEDGPDGRRGQWEVGMADTNTFVLDPGVCGQNLQVGSDKTASKSPTPSFLLVGDGGASQYEVSIDGAPIGTFNGDVFGHVCVLAPTPLADGKHVITGKELKPNPALAVTPFDFTVDTRSPAAPSEPVLTTWSDSPPVGDRVTKYRNLNFHGTADPLVSVQLFKVGGGVLGGGAADATGAWNVTTSTLADGNYSVYAVAMDTAGNLSGPSPSTSFTVAQDPTGVKTKPAPPSMNAYRYVTLFWFVGADGGSPITGFRVYRNDTLLVELPVVTSFTDPNSPLGSVYKITAINAVGESDKSTPVST